MSAGPGRRTIAQPSTTAASTAGVSAFRAETEKGPTRPATPPVAAMSPAAAASASPSQIARVRAAIGANGIERAGPTDPARGGEANGSSGAVTIVLALRRRRARAPGVYLRNRRAARTPGPLFRLAPQEGRHVERARALVAHGLILGPGGESRRGAPIHGRRANAARDVVATSIHCAGARRRVV